MGIIPAYEPHVEHVVRRHRNWRLIAKSGPRDIWAEIRDDNGNWIWPDCGWHCRHCKMCLGCLRKLIAVQSADFRQISKTAAKCKESPNGLHSPTDKTPCERCGTYEGVINGFGVCGTCQ